MKPRIQLTAVGLGPGDPELITLKGLRAITAADVIFVPHSREGATSRALRIAEPWLDHQRQLMVPLTIPMERNPVAASATYQTLAKTIMVQLDDCAAWHPHHLARGVYLLLGDPLLYGTFIMLREALLAVDPTIAIEIVPGIPSFIATAARVGLPLSVGDERVAMLSAPAEASMLRTLCETFETVVLMKVGRTLPQIVTVLDELGLLAHSVYAEYLGMPEERIVRDVGSLRGYVAPYLSLLIVRR